MSQSQIAYPRPINAGAPPWRALPVLVAGIFLVVLDFFIVNVALPSMQRSLHASAGELEWVVAGYTLTLASFLLTAGRLGDQVGRRRMFLIGIAVFMLASLGCVLALSPLMLVVARLAQGVGAAMIMPSMLGLIGVLYPGAARSRAIGVYGMVMGLAAAGGQLIGGLLIQADIAGLGWRVIFAINIPIGAAILLLGPRLIPESKSDRPTKLDPGGLVLTTATVSLLVLPLIQGQQAGWPAWTWAVLGLFVILLTVTIWQQRRLGQSGGSPLFSPVLLSVGTFRAGLIVQFVFWCGQASFYLFLSLYLQQGRGLSALSAGLLFTVLAAAYLVTSSRAAALAIRYGRVVLAFGAAAVTLGYAAIVLAMTAGSTASVLLLAPGLLLVGAGQGLCITPLAAIILSHAEPSVAGAVSGGMSIAQQLGGCVGVAVIGVAFYSGLPNGVPFAFALTIAALAVVSLLVIGLSRLLPGRPGAAR